MFLTILNFLQNFLIGVSFISLIALMVRRDINDASSAKSKPEDPTTKVKYFKSMTIDEKLKLLAFKLGEADRSLPHEKLDDFLTVLTEIQKIKQKVDKVYQNEKVQLEHAIDWLEKPATTRGQYKPLPRGKDDDKELDVKVIEKAIRSIRASIANPGKINVTVETQNTFEMKNIDKISNVPQKSKAKIFKTLDVKLQNILETRHAIIGLWSPTKFWCHKVFDYLIETIKIWYVTFMILRFTIFNWNSAGRLKHTFVNLLRNYLKVGIKVDNTDQTKITLTFFPETDRTGFFSYYYNMIKEKIISLYR